MQLTRICNKRLGRGVCACIVQDDYDMPKCGAIARRSPGKIRFFYGNPQHEGAGRRPLRIALQSGYI
jgi:hypothetical protein